MSDGTRAVAWRARAEALVFSGRLKEACAAYARSCALAEGPSERALLGQILVGRIGTLLAMGEFGPVPPMARRAETLLRLTGDRDYLLKLHINLGSGHYHRERYSEACDSYTHALRLMERASRRDAVWAGLQLNYGVALSQLACVEDAERAFRQAESYARAHGHHRLAAQSIFNRGALEALRGHYRAALRRLTEAEDAFEEQGAGDLLAASRLEQAQIYLDLFMPAEGRELARLASASFEAEDMLLDAELARVAEARSLLLLERPLDALERLDRAERFYRARRIPARRAEVMFHVAAAHLSRGAIAPALKASAEALRIAERFDLQGLSAACRCLRAELLLRTGHAARAEGSLRPLAASIERRPLGDRLAYWVSAARAARARGRRELAGRRYRRAAACLEAQRALIPGLELRARSFEQGVRVYHEMIELSASAPRVRVDPILQLMERARGRTFRELAAARSGKKQDEIAARRAVLGSMVRRLDRVVMSGQQADREEADNLRRQIMALERDIASRVRRHEAARNSVASGGAPAKSREIAALLAPGEVLIEFFATDGHIFAVLVSRERSVFRTLDATPAIVQDRLDRIRLQLDSFAATASRPVGNPAFLLRSTDVRLKELYDLLIRPLLPGASSGGERLTIVPHGLLHQVPFECLHDGHHYVDDIWQVVRCPTTDFLVQHRRRSRRTRARRSLVIAGTRPGSPFIEEEARRVCSVLDPGGCDLMIDSPAGDALQAMRSARIIHLSAHGNFRPDNPLFSTLHLGPDVLFLADILETPITADLAVLSACNSGHIFSGRGDALLGVAHAFLAAGARELVATLWRVHDQATAGWMEAFHRAHAGGSDPATARRTASLATRRTWPHPFHWGGFCVLGA